MPSTEGAMIISVDGKFAAKRCVQEDPVRQEVDIACLLADQSSLVCENSWILIEYARGGCDGALLPELRIARYTRGALLGLQLLHSKGILHRDVKAANMLLFADGTLKLCDYGLGKAVEESHSSHRGAGTSTRSPLEPVDFGVYSAARDVWALGCTTVEMSGGRLHQITAMPQFPEGCPAKTQPVWRVVGARGRYEVDLSHRLGSGGFGEVFRATHFPAEDTGAFSVVAAKRFSGPVAAAEALYEIRGLQAASFPVQHPNLVEYLDCNLSSHQLWIFLELMEGGPLDELIKHSTRLPEERIAALTRDVVLGLRHLHSNGIVHCDIKPANMLLTSDGLLKLGDFGLATNKAHPSGRERAGTKAYMSPEAFWNGDCSPPRDIWALGCTVLELCGGVLPPYPGHENCYPQPPATASSTLRSFCRQCLQMDPTERPDSVKLLQHPFLALPAGPGQKVPPSHLLEEAMRRGAHPPTPADVHRFPLVRRARLPESHRCDLKWSDAWLDVKSPGSTFPHTFLGVQGATPPYLFKTPANAREQLPTNAAPADKLPAVSLVAECEKQAIYEIALPNSQGIIDVELDASARKLCITVQRCTTVKTPCSEEEHTFTSTYRIDLGPGATDPESVQVDHLQQVNRLRISVTKPQASVEHPVRIPVLLKGGTGPQVR